MLAGTFCRNIATLGSTADSAYEVLLCTEGCNTPGRTMPIPAMVVEQLFSELLDMTVPKHELWMRRARNEIEKAHKSGLIDSATYYNMLGVWLAENGELEASVSCGHKAVQLKPEASDYAFNLAISLTRAGRPEEAGAILEAILDARSGVEVKTALAGVYAALGKWKSARRMFAEASQAADLANPGHAYRLAKAAQEVGRHEDAVLWAARLLAVESSADLGVAAADPAMFIYEAPNEILRALDPILPWSSIHKMLLRFGPQKQPEGTIDAGDPSDADSVREAWSDLRVEANAAVLGGE